MLPISSRLIIWRGLDMACNTTSTSLVWWVWWWFDVNLSKLCWKQVTANKGKELAHFAFVLWFTCSYIHLASTYRYYWSANSSACLTNFATWYTDQFKWILFPMFVCNQNQQRNMYMVQPNRYKAKYFACMAKKQIIIL